MKFMIIDGNSLLFRTFYGTFRGDSTSIMRAKNGVATNAIYALANIITRIAESDRPDYALVAFDSEEKTFRHQQFPAYKAGRKETPVDLLAQFPLAEEFLTAMGFSICKCPGYEADDIVGSMAKLASKHGFAVEIFSGDRDLLQLIDDNVVVKLTKKGFSELVVMDKQSLHDEMGISPAMITDLKGLMGDASDNIPGIAGIGEKTALKLLHEYGSLEQVLAADITGKIGEKIKAGKSIATMSKQLATIYKDMEFSEGLDYYIYRGIDLEKVRDFYAKYDLVSLLKKLPESQIDLNFDFVKQIPATMLNGKCAIIMEMMEDNYHIGNLIGLGVANAKQSVFIATEDLLVDQAFLTYLKDETHPKIGYDIKRTLVALNHHNIVVNNFNFDLALASYLMDPILKDDPASVYHMHGKNIPFIENVYVRKHYELDHVANYACIKASYLFEIEEQVKAKLSKYHLDKLYYEVELPLVFVLAKMEINGVKIDKEFLHKKSEDVAKLLQKLESQIYELAGQHFNINSPSQLAEILFDKLGLKTNKKRSTSAEILTGLLQEHPIITLLLDYRRYAKLQSTYLLGLQDYILADGKIHTIYNQMLTQTGRLSSKYPNLQNITIRDPELKEVRKAFIAAKEGSYIASFDYSQIELRVLAHLANSASMIKAFEQGEDIHSETAALIFNVPLSQVTKAMRREAKVVNFGIVYGMSDWGLASELGIGVSEANDFITRYFSFFPEIKAYLNKSVEDCCQDGYVKTILGRYRYVREINDNNRNVRDFGKRIAMNTPIQGSAADIIKLAMIKVAHALQTKGFQTKMILQIHDELVFDVPYSELMTVIPLIENCMTQAIQLKVKLKVDCDYGYNWWYE